MQNQRKLPFSLDIQLFAEDPKPADPKPADPKPAEKKPADPKPEEKKDPVLEHVEELKKGYVKKEDYDKVVKQNNDIIDSIINGNGATPKAQEPTAKIDDLRKELFSGKNNLTNLEYAKKALALRKQLMDEGKPDPFLPVGTNYMVEQSEIDAAKRVAEVMQHCIDYAEGDSEAFTAELMRLTKDANPNAKPFVKR